MDNVHLSIELLSVDSVLAAAPVPRAPVGVHLQSLASKVQKVQKFKSISKACVQKVSSEVVLEGNPP